MIDLERDYKEFEEWYLLDPDADTSMLEKDEFLENEILKEWANDFIEKSVWVGKS